MIYILLAAVVALVLGPILWMRPTPREKRLARMRLKARSLNLHLETVGFINDKIYAALSARNPHLPQTGWMRYRLFPQPNERGPSVAAAWRQRRDKSSKLMWDEDPIAIEAKPTTQALLDHWSQQQDARYLALEIGERSVAIVWNEEGDEPEVTQIATWLQTILTEVSK